MPENIRCRFLSILRSRDMTLICRMDGKTLMIAISTV